jgi:phage protein U
MIEYAQWGDITFEVLSYREHKEENHYIYAHHATIQPPSSLQWMGGKELKKISMTLRWHNQWCDPEERYSSFMKEAEKGEAQKLVIATKIAGDYVVERINSIIQQVDVWGKPVIIDVDVEFTEYVKKEIEKRAIKSKKKKNAPAKTQDKKKAEALITR